MSHFLKELYIMMISSLSVRHNAEVADVIVPERRLQLPVLTCERSEFVCPDQWPPNRTTF